MTPSIVTRIDDREYVREMEKLLTLGKITEKEFKELLEKNVDNEVETI